MTLELYAVLAGAAALAAGAAAAGRGDALFLGWRRRPLTQRIVQILSPPAGRTGRRLGAAALAVVATAGALTAYAAQPSAPERLPAQVIGVTGSGDDLSLRLKPALPSGAERTIRIGEPYEDGWKLKALSNTEATLEKNAETQRVGLNPSGSVAVAPATGPAPEIQRVGLPDLATIDRLVRDFEARMPGAGPVVARNGLTLEEARRQAAYGEMMQQEINRRRQQIFESGIGTSPMDRAVTMTPGVGLQRADIIALLGQAAMDDQIELSRRSGAAAEARINAGRAVPLSAVSSGMTVEQARAATGLNVVPD